MDKRRSRRSAGPRTFNRDEAVDIAMRMFRRHGYEGVSIADLTTAIGIAPPSLYAAFGSKAGLYREALDRYADLPGALDGMDGARTLEEAVTGLLEAGIQAATTGERGCMVSTGLIQCGTEHQGLAQELLARRQAMRCRIAGGLRQWLEEPEAARLAGFVLAVLQGIAVQSRDGASADDLAAVARQAARGLVAPPQAGRATPPRGAPYQPRIPGVSGRA